MLALLLGLGALVLLVAWLRSTPAPPPQIRDASKAAAKRQRRRTAAAAGGPTAAAAATPHSKPAAKGPANPAAAEPVKHSWASESEEEEEKEEQPAQPQLPPAYAALAGAPQQEDEWESVPSRKQQRRAAASAGAPAGAGRRAGGATAAAARPAATKGTLRTCERPECERGVFLLGWWGFGQGMGNGLQPACSACAATQVACPASPAAVPPAAACVVLSLVGTNTLSHPPLSAFPPPAGGAVGRGGFRKCGRCHEVFYCSPACMASDWGRHEPQCEAAIEHKARLARESR